MRSLSSRSHPTLFVAVGPLLVIAAQCAAVPTLFGGHAYEFIQVNDPYTGANNTWATASAAAAASQFQGVNGYLATITSQAENDFLLSLTSGLSSQFAGAWLGGDAPEGWIVGPETGQAFSYTNFGGAEPNNSGVVYMNIGPLFANIAPGQWADDSGAQGVPDPNFDPVVGYFIEYDVPACPGDINGDGATNTADFNIFATNFGDAVAPNTSGDLTGDGLVTTADFNVLAGDFGCGS